MGRKLIVLDTHAWVWWHSDPQKLSAAARGAIDRSAQLGVSAISVWELATKVRRQKISLDREVESWISQALGSERIEPIPVTAKIAATAGLLSDDFHGDPADRIIAATAIVSNCAVITKDKLIRTSGAVASVW